MAIPTHLEDQVRAALERLCKWRTIFAGWQLGTRSLDDPEAQAVRDHREVTMLLRCEVNALTKCLLDVGIVGRDQFQRALLSEAAQLSEDYERKFPGAKATDVGIQLDARAAEWMKKFRL
jgi:hypothetical protein